MRVIAVANQKGGTGKTTTVSNLAAALARSNRRVLAIDLDSQGDLTTCLGFMPDEIELTSQQVLKDECDIRNTMLDVRPGLKLIPANVDMASLDLEMVNELNREMRLRRALRSVASEFDYCLLDCPPSLGIASINAFAACDVVMVCVQTRALPFRAVKKLLMMVTNVANQYELLIQAYALPTMFEKRVNAHRAVLDELRKKFDPACFSPIHKNVTIDEAQSAQKTVIDYAPTSSGAVDYLRLSREVIDELEERQNSSLAGRVNK